MKIAIRKLNITMKIKMKAYYRLFFHDFFNKKTLK